MIKCVLELKNDLLPRKQSLPTLKHTYNIHLYARALRQRAEIFVFKIVTCKLGRVIHDKMNKVTDNIKRFLFI